MNLKDRLKNLASNGADSKGEAPASKPKIGIRKKETAPAPVYKPKGTARTPVAPVAPAPVPEAPSASPFGKANTRGPAVVPGARQPPGKRITAWSYSRFSDWKKCPLLARFKHVDRLREPDNQAMARGSAIHKLAEDYVTGRLGEFPPELLRFKDEVEMLKSVRAECESEWAFNEAWVPVDWFSKEAWCRVKTDVSFMLVAEKSGRIIDYKTGKVNTDHEDQLSLYALAYFLMYQDAVSVVAELWYLDDGTCVNLEFRRDQLPMLKKYWEDKVRPMMNDTTFKATPSRQCSWCYFSKAKSGKCLY